MEETKKKTVKKVKVVEKKETTKKERTLNPNVWEVPFNADLIAQVLFVYNNNERKGTAHVKSRGDVSGGGKKPWKQKGTGRARQGSTRSPLWKGGGVTFASNNRNYSRKINKKMTKKATCIMLSERLREKAIEFATFDAKGWKKVRTEMLKDAGKTVLLISEKPEALMYLRNLGFVNVLSPEKLNAKHVVGNKRIVVDEEVIKLLEDRLTNGK